MIMIIEKTERRRIFNISAIWWMSGSDESIGGGAGPGDDARKLLPLAGRTILVVEDEFFVGLEVVQTLEASGADVIGPARSLDEAESLAADSHIDMAVLDVDLEGQYSFELALKLQQRGVRVVFATAHADDTSLFRGPAATIPRVGKPTTERSLLRALLPLS